MDDLQPETKSLLLIRHGQSVANTYDYQSRQMNMQLKDSRLTDQGRQQAKAIAQSPLLQDVELVICSPLSRALATACIAFHQKEVPILCVPDATEFPRRQWMSGYENVGRDMQELLKDEELNELDKFHDIDWHLMKDFESRYGQQWWNQHYDNEIIRAQVARLKAFIANRSEKKIAVVAHSNLFKRLLKSRMTVDVGEVVQCKAHTVTPGKIKISVAGTSFGMLPNFVWRQVQKLARSCRRSSVHPEIQQNPFEVTAKKEF